MAITAHFSADFADFYAKVLTAETQLEGLTRTSANVGASLQRMVDQFSGTRLIQQATLTAEAIDRIGGASKLTADELQKAATLAQQAVDKMAATGQQVPRLVSDLAAMKTETQELGATAASVFPSIGALIAGAFSVTAVIAFGKTVLAFGNDIQKVSQQTGMTYEQVQRLQYISDQTSTSFQSLTRSSQNLTEALGRGDAGVAGGVRELGLSMADLEKMTAYDRMVALAEAIKGIEDPLKRAAVARDVFGKDWRELMPAIESGFGKVGEAATVASDRAIEASARVSNAWQQTIKVMTIGAAEIIGALAALDAIKPGTFDPTQLDTGLTAATAAAERMAATLNANLIPAVQTVTIAKDQWAVALDSVIANATEAADTLKKSQAAAEADAAAYEKWAAAMVELDAAGDGWKGTLDGINGEVIEAIKYYLDAGVAQNTLATAFGLTAVEVKAVASALREYNDILKQVQALESQRYSLKDIQAWGATAMATNEQVMASELAMINLLTNERARLHANETAAQYGEARTAQEVANLKIAAVWAEVAAKEQGHQSASAMDQEYRTAVETNALYAIQAISEQADAAMQKTEEVATATSASIERVRSVASGQYGSRGGRGGMTGGLPTSAWGNQDLVGVGGAGGYLGRGPIGAPNGMIPVTGASGFLGYAPINTSGNNPANQITMQSGAVQVNYPIMNDPQALDQITRLVGDGVVGRLTRAGGRY